MSDKVIDEKRLTRKRKEQDSDFSFSFLIMHLSARESMGRVSLFLSEIIFYPASEASAFVLASSFQSLDFLYLVRELRTFTTLGFTNVYIVYNVYIVTISI